MAKEFPQRVVVVGASAVQWWVPHIVVLPTT